MSDGDIIEQNDNTPAQKIPLKERLRRLWYSVPDQHRKRALQATGLWLGLCLLTGLILWIRADALQTAWHNEIPRIEAPVTTVYLSAPPEQLVSEQTPDENTVPPPLADQPARVSVIVANLGISTKTTTHAIEDLPSAFTLAFSPYADQLQQWLDKSLADGHENMMSLPMEPEDYPRDDPGPKALLTRASVSENASNLAWTLRHANKISGVINYMGDRFLTNEEKLSPVLHSLKKADLFFVESTPPENTLPSVLMQNINAKGLKADVVLDNDATETKVRQALAKLENRALQNGYAVAIVSAFPATVNTLPQWAAGLPERNITLVPLSKVKTR